MIIGLSKLSVVYILDSESLEGEFSGCGKIYVTSSEERGESREDCEHRLLFVFVELHRAHFI